MKIKCPKCQGVVTIDDRRISDKGFRAKCPHCGNRIIIRKKPAAPSGNQQERPPETGPAPKAPPAPLSPRPTSQKPSERRATAESEPARLLRRIEQRQARRQEAVQAEEKPGPNQDIEFEDELADVSVEVSLDVEPQYMAVGITVFLAIALVVVLWWSKSIEDKMPRLDPPVDQSTRGAGALYAGADMKALVHRMRLKSRREDYRPYFPPLETPEIRVINEILKNCRADCPDIEKAGLSPLETRDGLFAEVSCANETQYNITYYWSTNSAWIDDKQCP